MSRYPFIQQHDEKDCGAASLSMISEFYGLKLPIAKFNKVTGECFYKKPKGKKAGFSSADSGFVFVIKVKAWNEIISNIIRIRAYLHIQSILVGNGL